MSAKPITTPKEAEAAVVSIAEKSGDDETAHGMEDDLWEGVLIAIAEGTCKDPAATARAALRSRHVEFERRCA